MTIDQLGITINDLAKTIDGLAIMMAKGFEELRNEFLPRFDMLEHKMDAVRLDVASLTFDGKKIKSRVEKLEGRVFGSVQEA